MSSVDDFGVLCDYDLVDLLSSLMPLQGAEHSPYIYNGNGKPRGEGPSWVNPVPCERRHKEGHVGPK